MSDRALKDSRGKPRISTIPPSVLLKLVQVREYGGGKYGDLWDWVKGRPWLDYYDAAQRHQLAWLAGEDIDPESGLPHLAMAIVSLMFLIEYAESGAGEDDRPPLANPFTRPEPVAAAPVPAPEPVAEPVPAPAPPAPEPAAVAVPEPPPEPEPDLRPPTFRPLKSAPKMPPVSLPVALPEDPPGVGVTDPSDLANHPGAVEKSAIKPPQRHWREFLK